MNRRVFLIVLDSFGIGYEPDADYLGDRVANNMKSIIRSVHFQVQSMY